MFYESNFKLLGTLGVRVVANILVFYNRCYRTLGEFKIFLMRILLEHIQYIKQLSPVRGNNLNNSSECYQHALKNYSCTHYMQQT
jgi:hypothetical protein